MQTTSNNQAQREYPHAKFQNPTNHPQVAAILEKYGDARQVVLKSPIFEVVCKPIEEGGWGMQAGHIIKLVNEYSLERVLWAVKQTKTYRGQINNRGGFFTNKVRQGQESNRQC